MTVTLVTITSVCFAFFGVPVLPLVDGGVLKILGKNKNMYGRQRMYGSISFGVASSLVGMIADWTEDMNSIFYVYAISAIFFILTAGMTLFKPESVSGRDSNSTMALARRRPSTSSYPHQPSMTFVDDPAWMNSSSNLRRKVQQFHLEDAHPHDVSDDEGDDEPLQVRQNEIQRLIQFATESSIIEAVNLSNPPAHRRLSTASDDQTHHMPSLPTTLWELIKQRQVYLFFLTMMLMGASLNMVISFLFIFLKQDLGASSTLVGLTGLVGSVTELLFFFYSRDLIRIFGIRFLIILGHVLTIVRVFAYTLLPKGPTGAVIALGLHLLNGIAFSALWGAGVVQADELAPPSLQATSQGILAAMYAGVGAGLGSLLGGMIYERWGPVTMFYVVILLTSFSLELYLETNTRCGLSDLVKWIIHAIMGTWRWIDRGRAGRRYAVPRWSGASSMPSTGPIRLEEQDG
ncbi:MFS general substrate transporter [Hesseltinella vesiculosa]|uniref:MFS general substrate transporter n=1 Tax=Hesseltinella vesiculosa TaxID=101127 RepID=A0A1X2G3J1_9FUNG|nr:MFS general substrate transporter [Hesseltinella vesiculosa]